MKMKEERQFERGLIGRLLINLGAIYFLLSLLAYGWQSSQLQRNIREDLWEQGDGFVKQLEKLDNSQFHDYVEWIDGQPNLNARLHITKGTIEIEPNKVIQEDDSYRLVREIGQTETFLELSTTTDIQKNHLRQVVFLIVGVGVLLCLLFRFVLVFLIYRVFEPFHRIHESFQMAMGTNFLNPIQSQATSGLDPKKLLEDTKNVLSLIEENNAKQIRFISDVSHELRTPVSVIKGYLRLLLRWGKDDTVVLAESLNASLNETTKMEIMISDMLDMIRIKGRLEDHENDATVVEDSIEKVVANFKVLHNDYSFRTHLDSPLPLARIYNIHLEQLLVILVDNAIKYTTNRKEVDISCEAVSHGLLLRVTDYGRGISQDDIKNIFDRFYRTTESRTRQEFSAGVGIGLSILKQISEAYGIKITVDSILGEGTTFTLEIPFTDLSDAETI